MESIVLSVVNSMPVKKWATEFCITMVSFVFIFVFGAISLKCVLNKVKSSD